MASTANLRSRRNAAQLDALAGVEREIEAQDSHGRRKYVREFNDWFRAYESPMGGQEVRDAVQAADIVLVGDYHALPASQRYAACLLEEIAMAGDRPVVLGVETIFARDQHVLGEWWRREIDEGELRQRIRFDVDWGYEWAPFYELLVAARDHGEAIYGLDCMLRENLRQIGARDRHAAAKIAEIRERHPGAVIVVLFGESHLAPAHLPRALKKQIPEAKILTVLQNIDALYWRAAGENVARVEAVRVSADVICVFNATPLEKYESYRLRLDQWSRCESGRDFAPTVYNLVESLARFLGINRCSPHNSTQPKFLVDMLPEVHGDASDAMLERLLSRQEMSPLQRDAMLRRVRECGSAYFPQANAFCIREFQLTHAGGNAARFLHHACRGLPRRWDDSAKAGESGAGPGGELEEDVFYTQVLEHALADFGSRILCPSRSAPENSDMSLSRAAFEKTAQYGIQAGAKRFEAATHELGGWLGNMFYAAYLAGTMKPAGLRRFFLLHLEEPGSARKACLKAIAKVRPASRKGRRPSGAKAPFV